MATILLKTAVNVGLYYLSRALQPDTSQEGPRLKEAQITSATEGVDISRLFGRMRIGGNVIWATNFLETVTSETTGGGKGSGPTNTVTSYSYEVSFAVGLCMGGADTQLGRVWIDNKLVDMSTITTHFYPGSDDQLPDGHMEEIEGVGQVPAYRGLCYLVFERLQLSELYGNRIPQVTVEVIKPLDDIGPDDLENLVEAVTLIPATGEYAYATVPYLKDDGRGTATAENIHNSEGIPNITRSLDLLEQSADNMNSVLVVVSWFGNDLRVGQCRVQPKVEFKARTAYDSPTSYIHYIEGEDGGVVSITNTELTPQTVRIRTALDNATVVDYVIPGEGVQQHTFDRNAAYEVVAITGGGVDDTTAELDVEVFFNEGIFPQDWKVSGLDRTQAEEVVRYSPDELVYGGTPSDISVKQAIADIKARGWRVVFYPFILMDQIAGNGLPDPYGAAEQPALPWRGRITCDPAAGQPGTVDKTAAAGTQVDDFFGTAAVSDVPAGTDGLPDWTGAAGEFGYRRMVLHYARLCQMAGGVDAFLVGTELRGITRIRDSATNFPAVAQLQSLIADVRTIMGPATLVSYAADWSEYNNYAPGDGTGDVFFNLDPLWDDADFVGIDNYLPLSDWRDGDSHLDYDEDAGITNPYSLEYLKGNIEGGEGYDWFYASDADRDSQTRTPITDGAHGKPWVFRRKDIRSWWENNHVNRPGGTESGGNTPWVPSSKPVWFTEFGCPAVDKGPNQPNVFFDPNSSEGAVPYYSSGRRDDLIQRRYLEATYQYWRDNGGAMVSTEDMFVWTWDARPYPEFPFRSDIWSDTENWRLGHWITGRLGVVPLALLVEHICGLAGLGPGDIDVTGLYGTSAVVRGYVVDQVMSPRDMLEPLMGAHNFDAFESGGKVVFNLKTNTVGVPLELDQLLSSDKNPGGYEITRLQETELPAVVNLSFYDEEHDYDTASVSGQKRTGNSLSQEDAKFPMVLTTEYGRSLCDMMIHEAWAGRNRAELDLPPSLLRVDPGDLVQITIKGRPQQFRITGIDSGMRRTAEGQGFDITVFEELDYVGTRSPSTALPVYGRSAVELADLPLLTGEEERPWAPRVLAFQSPWPGGVNVYSDDLAGGFDINTRVNLPSPIGQLAAPLPRGPVNRWDRGTVVTVDIYGSRQLTSTTDEAVLAGRNALAVQNTDGGWEVLQFRDALPLGSGRYQLSNLLRGQLGTETEMRDPVPAGASAIFIDGSTLLPLDITVSELNVPLSFRYGPASLPVSDTVYQDETRTFTGIGLKPYAPTQLAAEPGAAGDIVLSWVRRTRFNGDSWDQESVPLNEEAELYEVDIMDGSSVVRTITVTSPTSTYLAEDQVTDFGFALSTVTFRVYQMSATVGRGREAEETSDV